MTAYTYTASKTYRKIDCYNAQGEYLFSSVQYKSIKSMMKAFMEAIPNEPNYSRVRQAYKLCYTDSNRIFIIK
jgi:hypothetical protein